MYNRTIFKTFATLFAITSSPLTIADESVKDDKTIVITANRTAQDINDTLAAVEVITRQDIERIQPTSITDLLENIAGLDIVHNGGAGQSSSLFTRGTNSDHTLILIDGVRVGSATSGTKSFSTIPVAQIERIEVVKGPRAALWGSDAIGGVIQIFTRRLAADEMSVELTGGSKQSLGGNFVLGFGSDSLNNTLTISHENSHGFDVLNDSESDKDGYRKLSLAIRGEYQLSDQLVLDWVAQVDQGNNEFDSSYGGNESDFDNNFLNIRYTYHEDDWLTQFRLSRSRDESLTYGRHFDYLQNEFIYIPKENGGVFATTREQINLLGQYSFSDAISITGGIERYDDNVEDSTRFVIDDFDSSFEFGDPDTSFKKQKQTTKSAFISSSFNSQSFLGDVAIRYDDVDFFESNETFNLSVGYRISDNFIISANRAKGFKAPTFNDLYYPDTPFFHGNPDLAAEISYNNELLLKGHWGKQAISIASYQNNVSNLISYDFSQLQSINVDKAQIKGYEIVYQFRQGKLSHKLNASYVDALDKGTNTQLVRRAKEHYGYELVAALGDFSFFSQFNYIGRRKDSGFSDVYLKSHITVSLGASYQATEQLSFKLKVSDYTDAAEPTVANYNAPGQEIFLTVQYRNF